MPRRENTELIEFNLSFTEDEKKKHPYFEAEDIQVKIDKLRDEIRELEIELLKALRKGTPDLEEWFIINEYMRVEHDTSFITGEHYEIILGYRYFQYYRYVRILNSFSTYEDALLYANKCMKHLRCYSEFIILKVDNEMVCRGYK